MLKYSDFYKVSVKNGDVESRAQLVEYYSNVGCYCTVTLFVSMTVYFTVFCYHSSSLYLLLLLSI